MKIHKTDRRSVRTRRLVSDAFVSLLQAKRYDDITVQDLLDRADIGRSTFYAQYYDKDDVLASVIEQLVAALSHELEQTPTPPGIAIPSLSLFQHMQEQYRLYQALVRGRGFDLVVQALHAALSRQVASWLRRQAPRPVDEATLTIITEVVVGAFLTLLRWWLASEMPLKPEFIDARFQQLMLPGIQQMLAPSGGPGPEK